MGVNGYKDDGELRFQVGAWKGLDFRLVQHGVGLYWDDNRHMSVIRELVPMDNASRVLDVGCGVASVLNVVPGVRSGVDPLMKEYAAFYPLDPDVFWEEGSGEELQFPDNWADVVFCSNVLDHVTDPVKVLSEVRRVMEPAGRGGRFVLTVNVYDEGRVFKREDPTHPHHFTVRSLFDLVSPSFDALFAAASPVSTQVCGFLRGERVVCDDCREAVLVLISKDERTEVTHG